MNFILRNNKPRLSRKFGFQETKKRIFISGKEFEFTGCSETN
jgi:hypothetical protein